MSHLIVGLLSAFILKRYSPSTIYQPSHLNQPSSPNDHENQQDEDQDDEINLPPSHDNQPPSSSLLSHLSSSPVKQSSIVLLMGYLR